MNSFLEIIKHTRGDSNYQIDRYDGAGGSVGSPRPTGTPGTFMFATGIECSYPMIDSGRVRLDRFEECGHNVHWRRDLQLVSDLGLKVLRYGLPYYSIHTGPDRYDWSFADEVMNEIKRLRITPILDLLHFGLPDWLGSFQNPEFPLHFATYARAVARRYPWVRYYTPVSEINVTALASAYDGVWNEQLKSDRAFITATKHTVAASILATYSIVHCRPDAVIVQSERTEYVHDASASPPPEIALCNKLRFLALDLLYAHPPDTDVTNYAMDNGLTREEYDWFMEGEPAGYQVMGNDYYERNERILLPDGSFSSAGDILGGYQITKETYDRYRKPVMHTETNIMSATEAPSWLWKQWINILRMRRDDLPVLGFTWYSLTDQIERDTTLTGTPGHVNECGLYDLERRPRPVATAYRELLDAFGQVAIIPHRELFEITG